MTLDEARRVAAAVDTLDGQGCVCYFDMIENLRLVFPEFTWTYTGSGIAVTSAKNRMSGRDLMGPSDAGGGS
jgi:hypothetical protein